MRVQLRRGVFLLVAAALALATGCAREEPVEIPEGPVEWSVSAVADVEEVQVGDDLRLSLTVRHPPGGDFVPPVMVDFAPFEVIDSTTEELSPIETLLHYRLAAYRLPEDLEVPALTVRYRNETGAVAEIQTLPVPVRLVTSLTPDVTEIHDIKGPAALAVPRDWSLLFWLLVALLAAVLAYIIYRRFQREPEDVRSAPARLLPAPDVEADAALRTLWEKGLVEKGEYEPFYTELTEIMKRYAGRRFEVPYLERTTAEILIDLRPKEAAASALAPILNVSDLVKFAKQVPEAKLARDSYTQARELIRWSRPRSGAEGSNA